MPYPRKPTSLKIAQGTWRSDRANPAEPKPDPGVPPCPKELDKAAKAEWRRLAPTLVRLGLLAPTDLAMFAAYCASWSTWKRAQAVLAERGPVHTTPNGHQQRSPWCAIGDEAFRQLERAASHFGLSPASRTKVTAIPYHQRDAFDELLDGPSDAGRAGRGRRRRLLSSLVTGDEDPAEAFFQ